MQHSQFPLRVSYPWWIHLIYALGIFVFTYFTWLTLYTNQASYAPFFIGFILLDLLGWTTAFTITFVGRSAITVRSLFATYQLRWKEIIFAETNGSDSSPIGNTIIFHGEKKAIVVDLTFKGHQAAIARVFLAEHIVALGLPVHPLNNPFPKNINTRIR
jgi:hypothetical protein